MLLPVLAALACTLTSPATPASAGPSTVTLAAMSLPLDAGPASPAPVNPDEVLAANEAMSSLPTAELALALTPAVVECADDGGARPPAPDCSALASRWTADMVGSCELPRPSFARIARIRRALAGSSRLSSGGVGALRELPPPLLGDPQNPVCPHAVASLRPASSSSPLAPAPAWNPASPPGRRLDRPPRA
jgi:hypothetical protein